MAEIINNTDASETRSMEANSAPPLGDLQGLQAAYRLNGKNYLKWSQVVRTFLKGKGKLSHLLGTGPKEGDPKFDAWDEADSMVMSWLWNSMLPEISDTCMFLTTAKEIWDAIGQTYSKVHDAAQIYEIKIKISATKQGENSVTKYANLLKNLWQEMDHYQCIKLKCSDDAAMVKRLVEKDRIYDFLAGLNMEFDPIRVQILGKDDLPSLNETIAVVRAEEGRRGVMMEPHAVKASAMVSKGAGFKNPSPIQSTMSMNEELNLSKTTNKDAQWCTHCRKPRHTRERCWKLHGKPSLSSKNWTMKHGQQRGNANMTYTHPGEDMPQEQGEFKRSEIEKLRNFLGSLEKPTNAGACSLALSGLGDGEEDWTC